MTTVAPVNQRGSAKAVFVEDFDDEEAIVPAGHWHFYTAYSDAEKSPAGIMFGCPCGCGSLMSVGFDTHESRRPRWNWNGEREAITLTPSIAIQQMDASGNKVGEHWHGFLTNGEFVSC